MAKIAILNVNSFGRFFPEHIEELEEKIGSVTRYSVDEDINGKDLAELVGTFDYIVMGTTPRLDREFFENQTHVKLISRHGIGFNHIDLEAARERGIYVCKELGEIERDAVAEQAVSLLLSGSKRLVTADAMVRSDEWKIRRDRLLGVQVSEKVTGVIGLGNIGSRFAEIMKYGFKNRVLVYDPNVSPEVIKKQGYEAMALDDLLEQSDFVSLHCNLNESNVHMINERTLSLMKPTSVLVNTARGGLIHEPSLYNALALNKISFFGTDVMTDEPVPVGHPLLELENTVFTPHVGVYNERCIQNMDRKVMEDIYLVHKGKSPVEIVNGVV